MGFLKALLVLLAIPAVGFGVSSWALADFNQSLRDEGINYDIGTLCADSAASASGELASVCGQVGRIELLQNASMVSGVVAVFLLLVFVVAAAVAGTNRRRITTVFPPLVVASLAVLAVLVLVQGGILTYAVYLAEAMMIGRVHMFLIAGVAIGALAGGYSLVQSVFQFAGKQDHVIVGTALDEKDHPLLHRFAADIAQKLGSRKPDHIVVGLEPNFYVTSANVKLTGNNEPLVGETLYLSLPLARIFTKEEIRSVIGHELGHFRGRDTAYSLKFAPVYAGLSHGVQALQGDGDALDIARYPAKTLLEYMIDIFHRNVSLISREREFEADKAAFEVAPPMALATALLKIGLYASAWNGLQQTIVERMQKGKIARNTSRLFASIVKFNVNAEKIPEAIEEVARQTVSHPTDSHPPTATRIKQAGIVLSEIPHAELLVSANNSIDLIEGHLELEEHLTRVQQQQYVALGVQVPKESEDKGAGTLIAALGAHMVLADGKVEPEEVDHAEGIGMKLSEHFDTIEFREFCHYADELPDLDRCLQAAKSADDEGRRTLYRYLQAIAAADDETSDEEQALLAHVADELEIDAAQVAREAATASS